MGRLCHRRQTRYSRSGLSQGIGTGYAVVSVNYRLSGEAIFPAGLQDIKAAIRWLRANSKKYHLDGNRIAACGGSAGGNYAAMVCLTANVTEFDDLSSGQFRISLQRPGSSGYVWSDRFPENG